MLCLVLFLDGLDVSMVGVALPSIGNELGLSTTSLQWIINGYVLGFGGLLLLGGRTADLLGRRKVFLIALTVFAIASLVGGLVDNGTLLIASRFVKGLAAAFTAPTAMSILTTTFKEGPARNRALSVFSVFGASGYSSGLILGGLLTSAGWRFTFLMPVPFAVIALIGGYFLIPRDRPADTGGGHDLVGAVTLVTGMLLTVYTMVSAPTRGWAHPMTLGSFAVAAVLLATFFFVEKKVAHPLVRLGLLRVGTIVRANLAIIALFGSYLSFQFMMTIFLQSALGWSPPLKMAMALLPAGIIVAFGSPFVGRLVDLYGSAKLIIAALTSLSVGYLWFLFAAAIHRRTSWRFCERHPARTRIRAGVHLDHGPGHLGCRRLGARFGVRAGEHLRSGRCGARARSDHCPRNRWIAHRVRRRYRRIRAVPSRTDPGHRGSRWWAWRSPSRRWYVEGRSGGRSVREMRAEEEKELAEVN